MADVVGLYNLSSCMSLSFKPWLTPLCEPIATIGDCTDPSGANWVLLADAHAQNKQISNYQNQSIRFAPQQLNTKQAYELGIAQTGIVTCRTVAARFTSADERHDWYNALMWLQFPRSKALLNQLQTNAYLAQIANSRPSGSRGTVRDALTVFDENALILCHDNPRLIDALRSKQWTAALHASRDAWGKEIKPFVLGHALLQKLDQPFKSITAHAYVIRITQPDLADLNQTQLDTALCASLKQIDWSEKPFFPLPVLGIPFWSEHNADIDFYNDPKVFRASKGQWCDDENR